MFQKIFPSVFFLLFFVVSIQAQKIGNKKYINEVHKVYSDKLQLNKIQHKKFKEVLKKFNPIINDSSRNAEIVVLGNLHPSVQLNVLDQIEETKSFVILDTMNFWMDTAMDELKKAISKTDLIVINDEEAEQLTNEKSLDSAANKIFEMGPKTVIIKKGDQGSEIFNSTESFYIPAYPVKAVVDPTGAGDCFAGGLAGYLSTQPQINYSSLKKSMVFGTVVASYCVENFGVKGVQDVNFNQIEKRLEIFKPYLL